MVRVSVRVRVRVRVGDRVKIKIRVRVKLPPGGERAHSKASEHVAAPLSGRYG
jgi:hypothetical protein